MFLEQKTEPEYFFSLSADNLFRDVTSRTLKSLDKIRQTKRFRKGVRFFSTGDVPRCVYILRKGNAQLFLKDESKNIYFARLIEPNEILGLTETIVDLPYQTSAKTITSCICECIGHEALIRLLQNEPELCFRLVRMLGFSLQKSRQLFFLQ